MSDNQASNVNEIKKTERLLQNIKSLASEASLTGSLSGSARAAGQQYNAILRRLEQIGEVPAGFFTPLGEDANLDEIGFAASQLATYIHVEEDATEATANHHNPGTNVEGAYINIGSLDIGDIKLEKLKELGELLRGNLSGWLNKSEDKAETTESTEAQTPPPATPPTPPTPTAMMRAAIPAEIHPVQFVPDTPGVTTERV